MLTQSSMMDFPSIEFLYGFLSRWFICTARHSGRELDRRSSLVMRSCTVVESSECEQLMAGNPPVALALHKLKATISKIRSRVGGDQTILSAVRLRIRRAVRIGSGVRAVPHLTARRKGKSSSDWSTQV